MLWRFLSPLVVLLGLVGTGEPQYTGCDYAEVIEPGRSYPIFSPGYPNNENYRPGTFCRWNARSSRPIQIKCQPFIIPYQSPGCTLDVLLIQTNPRGAQRYCGEGQLNLVSEGNQVTIALQSSRYSPGGRFLCVLQTVPDQIDTCRCGWKNPTRIVGGTTTGVNEYPMMAGVIHITLRILYCGGTIINDRQVVTAAHCITDGMSIRNVAILVGDHDLEKATETNATVLHTLIGIVLHPRYNADNQNNDIAILTTATRITFSLQVGPACLPFQHRFDSFSGNYVEILGWGSVEFGEGQSKTLQKAEVRVLTPLDCRKSHPNINGNQTCTLGAGKDSCQYDSGGPVLWRNPSTKRIVLIALVSFGSACASGTPAVNTRVGGFIEFFAANKPADYEYCIEE
ncbi:venom serine protease-like isoform X2 [Diachasmimorpha longicaudata]|uniref:venom serine protease-like isoform X2 n=1 Tax=Diachasmimorpha longicaudata TaxID=58733 RepID=UPI0030B898D1